MKTSGKGLTEYTMERCEEMLRLCPSGAERLYRIALGASRSELRQQTRRSVRQQAARRRQKLAELAIS